MFLKILLCLDNSLRKLITRLSIINNNGKHPKHEIQRYEDWFLDRLSSEFTVLEVGSHTGDMSYKLAQKVKSVYAIEIVQSLVKTAQEKNKKENIKYIHGDATQIDKLDEENPLIDVIILSNVLEHIEKRKEFLSGLWTNFKFKNDEIKILIRVPMITRDWLAVYKKENNIDYRLDPTHFTEYTEKDLRDEIGAAGLAIQSFDVRFGEAYLVCTKA